MAVFTTEQLRTLGIGQTIKAKATANEMFTVRTLANRLKMVDGYAKHGIDLSVHYEKEKEEVSVSKKYQMQ
jgi:hypothetical protein